MKFQFSTSTALLATAFVAVSAGGIAPYLRRMAADSGGVPTERIAWELVQFISALTPLLTPFLFAAYAAGRRALTAKIVLAFAIAESTTLAVWWWRTS